GNGCVNTAVANINVYALPNIGSVNSADPSTCGGTDGSITVNASGGTGSIEYRIDGGAWQSSNSFSGLAAGSYAIEVRNNNGSCVIAHSSAVVLSDPASPTANIILPSADCVGSTHSFSATNAGGGAAYSWNFGTNASPATATGIGPHTVTYTSAGSKSISLEVTATGCVANDAKAFTVFALPSVALNLGTDEACVDQTNITLSGGSPIGGIYSGPNVSGSIFNPAAAGVGTHTITYTYTDANGCVNTATDDIEVHALPAVSLSLGIDEACVDQTSIALSGGSPAIGVYSGANVSGSTFNPAVAGVGTHTITYTITDPITGCVNTTTDNITVHALPAVSLNLGDDEACEDEATLSLSGGSPGGGNYSGPHVSGSTFDVNAAGVGTHAVTYTYTDANGCTNTANANIEVHALPLVTFTLTDDEACLSENSVTLAGGSPVGGTYSGSHVSGGQFDATSAGVGTHTITYTYTDANGCINIATDDILVLALPAVNLTLGDTEACVDETSITLSGGNPSGGTYSGSHVSGDTFDVSAAGAGTYTITYTYTDANGCINIATDDLMVHPFPIFDAVVQTDVTTCGVNDGSITVTASSGSGTYEYRINAGPWQSSNVFAGLSAGSYNLEIRNSDGTCTTGYGANPVVIADPPGVGLSLSLSVTSDYLGYDISCFGASDATATVVASSGTAPYTYVWSNGQVGADLLNVAAGTYFVTVTDDTNCEAISSIDITQPDQILANATVTDVSCYGLSDGEIDLNVTGGVNAYTYSWDDLEAQAFYAFDGNTDDQTGNGHNDYGITGTEQYSADRVLGSNSFDFNGSTKIKYDDNAYFMETSIQYRTILVWIKPDDLTGRKIIYEEGGNVTGLALRLDGDRLQGVARSWGSDYYAPEITIANDGQWHQVGIIYDNGDITLFYDGTLGATNNSPLGVLFMLPPFNQSGVGGSFGSTAFNNFSSDYYEGLMDNFSYHRAVLSDENVSDVYDDDGDREGLPAGTYDVLITDFNGCNTTITVTVGQPDSLWLETAITDVNCFGENNGALDLTVNGGNGGFVYAWSNGANSEDLTNLPQGDYTVTVTDVQGCSAVLLSTVNEPALLTLSANVTSNYSGDDISCPGATDGAALAVASGGRTAYTYTWSTGATTATLTNVGAGTYGVTVTDANGCTAASSVTLTDPSTLGVNANVISSYGGEDISCAGATDGSATALGNGGNSPYTYLWSNGQVGTTLSAIGEGTYGVTVTDANGCTANTSVTLQDPPILNPVAIVTSNYNGEDVSCPGATDGSAYVTTTGGIGNYTYLWSTGYLGDSLVNIGAGIYTVTVTDDYGCTARTSVVLDNPVPVNVAITVNSDYNGFDVSCQGGTDGNLTASATGGVGGFNYEWSDGQTTANISNAQGINYRVTATDANGCTAVAAATITQPDTLTLTFNSAAPTDCGIDDGIILLNGGGGIGAYEYSLGGITWQSSNVFTGLSSGTYFAYVRNTFGTCTVGPIAIVVDVTEAPTIDNVTIIHPTAVGNTDGGILVGASGNGLSLEYRLVGTTTWQSSNLFQNLGEGTYTVEVRYFGQSCIASSTVTLEAGKGVESTGSSLSFCSGDVTATQFVETYFIPAPEDDILTALTSIYNISCTGTSVRPGDPVFSYVSMGVVESGTIIHYDHWEDGYEPNLSFPIQSTTEIWGDGNLSNGAPPGFAADYLSAADIIVLANSVITTTRGAVIDWDAGDKIGSRGNLSMTRLGWAENSSTLFAGALEVYPKESWGSNYVIPVGENADVNQMFSYTGAVVMAERNGTVVNYVDNGSPSSTTLNQGESFLIDGNI
ncbi:MAG: hypothetical protein AAGD05_01970, partial [Bacteroidota bacterium]